MELNEELEATISSSNALMSTSAVLRAGGLVVGNIPMGASGSERGSKMALSEGAKTFAGSPGFWIYLDFLKTSHTRKDLP